MPMFERAEQSLESVPMRACVGRAGNHGEGIMFITTTSSHCCVIYHLPGGWKSMWYSRLLNELTEIYFKNFFFCRWKENNLEKISQG